MLRAVPTLIALSLVPAVAWADTVIATRTIRPEEVLTNADVRLSSGASAGVYSTLDEVIGQEARVVLYAGRDIRRGDLRPPALVARNAVVSLIYRQGGLEILAEGRSLARGSVGDTISVLNTASRSKVLGVVQPDGRVLVQ
ncbi:flagellar basal body P-ring formation chaperone FlgA [Mesobacterium sp. TK19101]|uniref:Flagella basal body P-ring formation protein FlgA n=1 Tax=Mesobacterium hydrothermale TaxID=3111907 RepID=A0ABU6HGP8_9RHOB|nr:flagellar basal body P-ring formation chaperone FlgA [Mesobacterium sp. TK19101]MEC3861634.1 flagellar basal body P-ring formation chaperone FlgA [Mesobacterium sp. TK19101]